MQQITHKDLLNAGVHFGHLKKKWNPQMSPYIFMERKGIHVIDLYKTNEMLSEAASALKSIARSGRKILYVATKKQAQELASEAARSVNMPYVTDRWLGGMMTNFATIRKSIKKMQSIDRMLNDGTLQNVTKKERLSMEREQQKLERVLGGISQLNRLPSAVLIVDTNHEDIALAEANKLNITTFAMVDTNSDPSKVDFPIPSNDDSTKSIEIVVNYLTEAIQEGLEERKQEQEKKEKDKEKEDEQEQKSEEEEAKAEEEEASAEGKEKEPKESGGKGSKKGTGKRRRTKKVTSSSAGKSTSEKSKEEGSTGEETAPQEQQAQQPQSGDTKEAEEESQTTSESDQSSDNQTEENK